MSFLRRLFGGRYNGNVNPTHSVEERAMHSALQEAKQRNREAASELSKVADRQVRDSELIRQVVSDILDRADKRKIRPLNRKAT